MKTKAPGMHIQIENNTPRIIAMILLAALLLIALTGCKSEYRSAGETIKPTGVYTLVSVDGKNVPCVLKHEGVEMTVKSGVFTINRDGTCRSQSTFAVRSHQDVHRDVQATYTQNGTKLTMRWKGAGLTKGEISGDTFTMNNEGMIFFYRK